MWRAAQKGHCYCCPHNRFSYYNSSCREMLQSSDSSGATISLLRYSTYKKTEDCYKTPIQPTTAKLNTADGSPMSAIAATALYLRIAEFKFTHNFIICDQLPETELIFGINIQRKFSLILCLGQRKKLLHTKGRKIFSLQCMPVITRQQ